MIAQLDLFKKEKGLVHGFAGKLLGDFSLSNKSSQKNQQKLLKELKIHQFPLVQAHQVHGNNIALISNQSPQVVNRADGLITLEKNLTLGVRSADCLPIIYYEPDKKIIAIAHAGWRGILAGLPHLMIQYIESLGGKKGKIIVGIGPHIGPCCYRVDKERIKKFKEKYPFLKRFYQGGSQKNHLNLLSACRQQLEKTGIKKHHFESSNICSACRADSWWSHRREGKTCGNMLTVIYQKDDQN